MPAKANVQRVRGIDRRDVDLPVRSRLDLEADTFEYRHIMMLTLMLNSSDS